jgi:transposase
LTAQRYRDEILDTKVRLYAGAIGNGFILMDDNARAHTANGVQNSKTGYYSFGLTGPIPDLNPIEYVWNELNVRISVRFSQKAAKSLVTSGIPSHKPS